MKPHIKPLSFLLSCLLLTSCTLFPSLHNNPSKSAETITQTPFFTLAQSPKPRTTFTNHLYFLGFSNALNNNQIYKMDLNDLSIEQVTNDPDGIYDFDISLSNGIIVYSNNNHYFFLLDPNNSNSLHQILDQNGDLRHPVWSPNGKIISYRNKGIYFYYPDTNSTTLIISDTPEDGKYANREFSPDNTMMIISTNTTIPIYIYSINLKTITYFKHPSNSDYISCGLNSSWSPDSSHVYLFNNSPVSGGPSGLNYPGFWRYSIDGTGVDLFPSIIENTSEHFYKVISPWEDAQNEYIYFLLSPPETDEIQSTLPYSLVRSKLDNISQPAKVRPETFFLFSSDYVLWDNNTEFVIMTQNYQNKRSLLLVPIDPSLPTTILMDDASSVKGNLRWGP